jgi:hypothetical protein
MNQCIVLIHAQELIKLDVLKLYKMMVKYVIGIQILVNVKHGVIVHVVILIKLQLLHVLNFHVIMMHQLKNVQQEHVQL